MATPTSLTLSPSSLTPGVGKTTQMTATVHYDDGSSADVTSSCTWSSSDTAVATVSSSGLVTTLALGTTNISASYTQSGAVVKTTQATDDFNRADGTLASGNWVKPSSYTYAVDLIGNRLRAPKAWSGKKAGANWATPMTSAHQWAKLRYADPQDGYDTSGYKGVKIRANAAGDTYYFAGVNNTSTRVILLGKCVSGTITVFAGASPTVNAGDEFEVQGVDNGDGSYTMTVYKNGVATTLTHTDSSIASGDYIGIHLEGQIGNTDYCYFDDFAGGDWRTDSVTVSALAGLTSHEVIPRYRLNGPFESSLKSTESLAQLLSTFAAQLTWSQGKWCVAWASLKEPVLDLDDSDAKGPIQYQAQVSQRDKCNGVKGVYVSPDNEWQPSDFPAYLNAKYLAEDSGKYGCTDKGKWQSGQAYEVGDASINGAYGWVCKLDHTSDATNEPGNGVDSATYWDAVTNRLWRDVRLPYTLSASEAQRLAKIECVRSRMKALKYVAGLRAYAVRPGQIVTVTHARFGWNKKRFEVVSSELVIEQAESGPDLKVNLVLREDDPDGYGWTKTTEETDPTPPGPITVIVPTTPASLVPTTVNHLYVSPSGSDTTGAGTSASPYQTLGKAHTAIAAAGLIDVTVHVADGTYTVSPQLDLSASGASGSPIVWKAEKKWGAKIVSSGSTSVWEAAVNITGNYNYLVDFDVYATATTQLGIGVHLNCSHSRVIGCKVHDIPAPDSSAGGAGICSNQFSSSGPWGTDNQAIGNLVYNIGDYTTQGNRVHGIYWSDHYGYIANNLVYQCQAWGIIMGHAADRCVTVNNTVFSNGNGGICMSMNAADNGGIKPDYIVVRNNIAYHNGICSTGTANGYGLREYTGDPANPGYGPHLTWENNLAYDNLPDNCGLLITTGTGTNTVLAAPGFVNWQADGTGDYRLAAGSPCIDAGSSTGTPTTDFAGSTRDAFPDIGAYEYTT